MSRAGIRAQISSAEAQIEECSRKLDRLQREVTELTRIRPAVNRAAAASPMEGSCIIVMFLFLSRG